MVVNDDQGEELARPLPEVLRPVQVRLPATRPTNRQLFAFASYNAGPGKVSRLRKEAAAQGLDPNRWFNNVELIAAKEAVAGR